MWSKLFRMRIIFLKGQCFHSINVKSKDRVHNYTSINILEARSKHKIYTEDLQCQLHLPERQLEKCSLRMIFINTNFTDPAAVAVADIINPVPRDIVLHWLNILKLYFSNYYSNNGVASIQLDKSKAIFHIWSKK